MFTLFLYLSNLYHTTTLQNQRKEPRATPIVAKFFFLNACKGGISSVVNMALKVDNPASFLISGPSQSGKTHWIFRLIEHRNEIFTEKIEKIFYFYDTYQKKFDQFVDSIEFIQGLPSLEILKDASQSLVVLDDLIHYPKDVISKIFTVYSHHYNFSVIFTTQNLFNKSIREISLNSHFVVLFKNCHDATQIQTFMRQAFQENAKNAFQAYKNATSEARGYLLLDFRPDTYDSQRIRTGIFPNEVNYIYQ